MPAYGTAEQKKVETEALARLSQIWNCSVTFEQDDFSPIDGKLYVGGDLVSIIEFKFRDFLPGAYPTYMLDALKWNNGKGMADRLGCNCGILLEFSDNSLWWADITERELPVVHNSGRTYLMRDEYDIKDVVLMPKEWFKPVKPDVVTN